MLPINAKSPRDLKPGALLLIGQLPTLPHTRACSTIGAEELNFRVRDGNGWDLLARVTQRSDDNCDIDGQATKRNDSESTINFMVKPNGLLVTVSSTHCYAY